MMDQAGVFKASVCAVAVSVMTTVLAQDAQPSAEQPSAAAGQPAAAAQPADAPAVKLFDPLVRVLNVRGVCEVKNPDVGSFQPVMNNKAYPLGSTFRAAPGGSADIVLSAQESVQLLESSEVVVTNSSVNPAGRVLGIVSGKVKTTLRDNLPEGSFGVDTPNAICRNVVGRGEFKLAADAATETLLIKIVTGSARVEGPQFQIPALRAANTVEIQTANDRSLSRLTSVSGDFAILLENGTETPVNYGMSPNAVVKIWRESAPVGGRPIISTLVVSSKGMARHRFAYAAGRSNLSTGELIVAGEGDDKEKEKDKEAMPVLLSTEGTVDSGADAKKEPTAEPAEKADKEAAK